MADSQTFVPDINVSRRVEKFARKIEQRIESLNMSDPHDMRLARWAANTIAISQSSVISRTDQRKYRA